MAERPLGLISVDELVRVLPDLIADALRERDTRPPPASQATLTKATGVVTTAGTTTAEVQLDEDEPGVISQVQLSAAVSAGDRVVVLMSPGGSAIAIGSGSAQTAVPLLNGPADPNGVITAPEGWLYEQNDAPDLWQNTDGLSAWQLVGSGAGNYWELAFDDLHLDPTTTAGIESISVAVADAVTGGAIQLYTERGSSFAVVQTVVNATSSRSFIEANDGSDDCYVVAEASGTFYTQTIVHHRAKQHLWSEALTAIADGELDVSEFSIWLDDTPGSTSLNIKAKDSGGTIRTGSIPLT